MILIVASKYFEALFTSEFSEKDSELVTIKGLNYDTLELLLKLIYTDELQFSDKCSLKDAFLAADYLMIDLALERLNAYALDNISQEIAMDILNLEGNVAVEVYEKAMEFFCKSLNIHRDIPALTIDQLMKVIKQLQNSSVSRLDTVVRSIPVWIKAAPSEREKYMFELLSIVDFRDNLLVSFLSYCFRGFKLTVPFIHISDDMGCRGFDSIL